MEDDPESANLIAEALIEHGYAVDVAGNGQIGLERILATKPDLVLCDVRMPRMSGFELIEKVIAAGPDFAAMPFIFLTALDDRDHELAGRRLGADDYLSKPVDFEMLGLVIGNKLRRRDVQSARETREQLTRREREVLTWVGRGKTSAEIAIILGVSERTINFHCDQAMRRLDVINRTQAVAKAVSVRLIAI